MEYDNNNSGALFKNDRKESDKHPEYKGTINVEGTDYYLSAWLNTSKAGTKYMSLKLSPKGDFNGAQQAPRAALEQDVPF